MRRLNMTVVCATIYENNLFLAGAVRKLLKQVCEDSGAVIKEIDIQVPVLSPLEASLFILGYTPD